MENNPSLVKKVVIIGDSGVGKTSILNRYVFDKFDLDSLPTFGTTFKQREIFIPET